MDTQANTVDAEGRRTNAEPFRAEFHHWEQIRRRHQGAGDHSAAEWALRMGSRAIGAALKIEAGR